MREKLLLLISDLRSDQEILSFDEAATKQAVVLRLLSILGWDCFRIEEVYPEFGIGSQRVDYALRLAGTIKVFIEVKRTGQDLEDHQKQLLSYSFQEGVKLAILTNGLTWWLYLPLYEGSWEDRRFYSIDLLQQEPEDIINRFVEFLSKENVVSGKALENAERLYRSYQRRKRVGVTLPKAWNKIVSDPDELLVELIGDVTEQLSGFRPQTEDVEKFLATYKDHFSLTERLSPVPPRRQVAIQPQRKPTQRRGLTGKSIVGFTFLGEHHSVNRWKHMLLTLSEIVYERHKSEFGKVRSLRGRKRTYFSDDQDEVFDPAQIGESPFYVDTNLSANSIAKLCRQLIELFGYSASDLKIDSQ